MKLQDLAPLSHPGVLTREHDISQYGRKKTYPQPICLIFGFSPRGAIMEPMYFSNIPEMVSEFGEPENTLERYFLNAGVRVINGGGTPLMVRLPYDNYQANNVKYVRYSIGKAMHRSEIYYSVENTERAMEEDSDGVNALEEIHRLDETINGYSRIMVATGVETMTEKKFADVLLDSTELEDNSIYIFDIHKGQLGTNPLLYKSDEIEYLGVVPILVSPSTALYYQEKIENSLAMDKLFNPISIPTEKDPLGHITAINPNGIITDCPWKEEMTTSEIQETMKGIVETFSQVVDFHHTGRFYDKKSLGDSATADFPLIRYNSAARLDRQNFDKLGVVVFEMVFNKETEKVDFIPKESFCGYFCNTDANHQPIENQININSKYIRIIRKINRDPLRDYLHITNQPLVIFGERAVEVRKKLNYEKSLMEPIRHMLEAHFSDIDSITIDLILDAGLSTLAHFAWEKYIDTTTLDEDGSIAYGPDGTFYFNPAKEDVTPFDADPNGKYTVTKMAENCSTAWNNLTKMFVKFIENRRGDCLYLADGPRCLNISRNAPLLQHYPDVKNLDIFNNYLKYFREFSSSYGARFFNWVMANEYFSDLNIWMPPSVLVAELMCRSEKMTQPWYAPAGFRRGNITNAYRVSLRTKPYSDENDFLYLNQWNYFTENINNGVILEGNKTMQVETTALDRINVRRLCNYIKRRARNIANKYKYEPNTEETRIMFREEIADMLTVVQKNAGIGDFVAICNESNNPNEVIERNELRLQIWIKPIKAIEYIIIDLNVTSQNVQFTESFAKR